MKKSLSILKVGILLFCFFLLSAVVKAEDPEQYGTPFNGVPDAPDAVIYQVNMRCFSPSGDFQGVIDRLDHIQDLGVNVIYLMPFYPVGTLDAFNSPYCIKDLKSVGSEFGTLDDLRDLVDGAHSRGMAVMIDWVQNQTSWDHPWITEHEDWYEHDGEGNIENFSWYSDVAALDLSNQEVVDAMIDAMRYWIFTANIDGFRMDGGDAPPLAFWEQVIPNLRSISTHKLLLLSEGRRSQNFNVGFDFNFGFTFYINTLNDIFDGTSVTSINTVNTSEYYNASDTQRVARYLTNHDVYGSDGTPYDLFGGRGGVMASFTVITLMKSVPFIYNGLEVGCTVDIPFPFTGNNINWSEDVSVTPEMTKIISIYHDIEAARRGNLTSYTTSDICAFKKEMEAGGEGVFVVVNMRNAEKTFELPEQFANTTVTDLISDASANLETSLTLSAYEYGIYSYEAPVAEEVTSIEQTTIVYPNPSFDGLIHVKLKNYLNNVRMVVYDIQGKNNYEILLSNTNNTVDLSDLNKGLYIINFISSENIYLQKLMLQ